ncbi:ankyrin repeat-containing domain protein [Cladorrhinum sp. PSN332]|nr:ankyrin repeat-containing domain protein [Cladorrhinum sp. PSN332]
MSNTKDRFQGLQVLAPTPDEGRNSSETTIDIIAVPGLGANPAKSFGSEKNPAFNWLSDRMEGIRSEIPNARVLLYYYDSEWYGHNAQEQGLHNVSSKLLEYLVTLRKDDQNTRPLIFLGHSMGGLVVARAMTIANQAYTNVNYMRIVECFAGAIFFGSPFKGSDAHSRALMLAHLFEKVDKAVPSQLLEILKPGNDALVDLRRDFTGIALKEPRAKVICFYEELKTNVAREALPPQLKSLFGKKSGEILVSQDSASLDVATNLSLHRDHRQINRFDSAKENEYVLVLNQLKEIAKSAQFTVRTRLRLSKQSIVDDNVFHRLALNLNVGEVNVKLKSVQSSSGDSSWILAEEQYKHWLAYRFPYYPVLWVSGGEGLGKSKAAAATIGALEQLEERSHQPGARNVMVAYFFCDGPADCRMVETMLRSLIWQLILKKRSLGQYVKTFAAPAQDGNNARGNTQSGGGQFKLSKLWKGLTDILGDDGVQDVYFVINSLHYLSEGNSTQEFLESLSELLNGDQDERNPWREKVKWAIFSTNGRPNIEHTLRPGVERGSVLQINLNSTSMGSMRRELLRTFTRDAVKEVSRYKRYSSALQYFVFSSLQARAENNTLWVEVVCKLLQQLPADYSSVRKALEMLPPDPESLIEEAWKNVLNPDTYSGDAPLETVKEILRTLVVAYEDPTISELRVLAELKVELDPEDSSATEESIVLGYIRACGPLLRIYDAAGSDGYGRWETRVTFIHPLARETLLSPNLRKLIGLTAGEDDTEVKWQHGVIGLRCWDYMQEQLGAGDEFDFESSIWDKTATQAEKEEFQDEIDLLFPEVEEGDEEDEKMDGSALDYPLKYWLRHGNKATPDFVDTLDIGHSFWSFESTARKRWWGSFAQREFQGELKGITALHVAAYFGLLPLVESLLKDGHEKEIHSLDSWANQPLHWAAAKGNLEVCRRLLELPGIEIDNGVKTGNWTPLHMAASEGRLEVIQFLVEAGAQINAICNQYGTPLTLALVHRQADAAALLLDLRADPTIVAGEDEEAKSPALAVAAGQGNDDLVKKLLELYDDSGILVSQYGQALAAAASAGDLEIVQMLLSREVDWPWREEALFTASEAGFYEVTEAILAASPGIYCHKAFVAAAMYDHQPILHRLWQHHEQYSVLGREHLNEALYKATDNQQEQVIKFLLDRGADPNAATGEEYGNALTASAYDGTLPILQLLIQHGAQIAAPQGYPLQVAAQNGHVEIVKHLLNLGANPNASHPSFPHGTALQAACVVGETTIAHWLLSRRADPNHGGGEYTNPLTAATSNGHEEILSLLLRAGANANIPGGSDGSFPLINAAMTLPAKSLEELIRAGAHVDQQDAEQDTALIMSALYGDTECVLSLLQHGAQINLFGAHHGSALHAAASRGHADTCRALLDAGANPHTLSGPFHTALQAACASGSAECVKLILDRAGARLDLNAQGGKFFTALHAAAVHENDGALRHLLGVAGRKGGQQQQHLNLNLNVVPPKGHEMWEKGTPLHAAAFAACNRNARLLVEAGADVNLVAGKFGSVLQVASLKCASELVELLLEKGARIDSVEGKYGSALIAAVVRAVDYESDEYERSTALGMLLDHVPQQEEQTDLKNKAFGGDGRISVKVYRSALETAIKLGQKDDFKLILTKMQEAAEEIKKSGKKGGVVFPNVKALLNGFVKAAEKQHPAGKEEQDRWKWENNSDFGGDVVNEDQDYFSEWDSDEETEREEDAQKEQNLTGEQGTTSIGGGERGLPVRSGSGGYDGQAPQQTSRGFSGGGNGQDNQEQSASPYGAQTTRGFSNARTDQEQSASPYGAQTTRGFSNAQNDQEQPASTYGNTQTSRGFGRGGNGQENGEQSAAPYGGAQSTRGFNAGDDNHYGGGQQNPSYGNPQTTGSQSNQNEPASSYGGPQANRGYDGSGNGQYGEPPTSQYGGYDQQDQGRSRGFGGAGGYAAAGAGGMAVGGGAGYYASQHYGGGDDQEEGHAEAQTRGGGYEYPDDSHDQDGGHYGQEPAQDDQDDAPPDDDGGEGEDNEGYETQEQPNYGQYGNEDYYE